MKTVPRVVRLVLSAGLRWLRYRRSHAALPGAPQGRAEGGPRVPDAKVIVLLPDPVDSAYSHYPQPICPLPLTRRNIHPTSQKVCSGNYGPPLRARGNEGDAPVGCAPCCKACSTGSGG